VYIMWYDNFETYDTILKGLIENNVAINPIPILRIEGKFREVKLSKILLLLSKSVEEKYGTDIVRGVELEFLLYLEYMTPYIPRISRSVHRSYLVTSIGSGISNLVGLEDLELDTDYDDTVLTSKCIVNVRDYTLLLSLFNKFLTLYAKNIQLVGVREDFTETTSVSKIKWYGLLEFKLTHSIATKLYNIIEVMREFRAWLIGLGESFYDYGLRREFTRIGLRFYDILEELLSNYLEKVYWIDTYGFLKEFDKTILEVFRLLLEFIRKSEKVCDDDKVRENIKNVVSDLCSISWSINNIESIKSYLNALLFLY